MALGEYETNARFSAAKSFTNRVADNLRILWRLALFTSNTCSPAPKEGIQRCSLFPPCWVVQDEIEPSLLCRMFGAKRMFLRWAADQLDRGLRSTQIRLSSGQSDVRSRDLRHRFEPFWTRLAAADESKAWHRQTSTGQVRQVVQRGSAVLGKLLSSSN
jgi:hypothetical protein